MTADLAALLARERDRLVTEWARSLGRLFPAFTHRSTPDLAAAGRVVVDGMLHHLQAGDATVLRTLAADEAVARLLADVDLPDALRGFMVLREQAARLLEREIPDAAAQTRAYSRLIASTDLLLVELARRHQHLRRQPVGTAGPREELDQHLASETRRALRFRRPLALMLVAVDNYEVTARVYASTVAESAATAVSEILPRLTREVDIKVALSEGVFAVLLLETDRKDARWIAERVRVTAETGEGIERSLMLTELRVSVGLAAFPLHADGPGVLLQGAEESLAHARRLGGNTVVVVDELRSGERVP